MNNRRRPLALLGNAVELWWSKDAFQHAAALAFYTLFSMAPLLLIGMAIAGAVLGDEATRGGTVARLADFIGASSAEAVEDVVRRSRISESGLLPTVLGVAALLFGATTAFAQLQSSLNQFWDVASRPSRSGVLAFFRTRLESLGLALVMGLLLLISLVTNTGLAALVQLAEDRILVPAAVVAVTDGMASVLIASLVFAMIFKILPDVQLRWRDIGRSAFVTALLFVVGQSIISLYLTQAAPESAYGAAGSLVVVLFWVYYSALILFFGAALTRARIRLRGDRVIPKPTAVRVRTQILEE